jgi:predicted cobalt transporter CbtA
MSRKTTSLASIRSMSALTVPELHAVSREAAVAAATREAETLERAMELIEEAEALARGVAETAVSAIGCMEVRAGVISLAGACQHLRAAITSLGQQTT